MIRDMDVIKHIKKELVEKMQPSALDVHVDCKQGNVLLSGVVDLLSVKMFAEKVAKEEEGVVSVENKITIGMDSDISDSHIRHEIEEMIYQGTALSDVNVDIRGGTAVLMGHVESDTYKKRAVEIAASARGVVNVVDSIKIE